MTRILDAIYEGGVLRPLEAIEGLADNTRVRITISGRDAPTGGIMGCVGILPDDDAAEMRDIIEREFEQVSKAGP